MTVAFPRIINAEFIGAVHNPHGEQPSLLEQVAFVGRSNVGKSSLINVLCNQRSLAITSKTPGRTGALNFFEVELQLDEETASRKKLAFVDLPGYGYAKVSGSERARWSKLAEAYFSGSEQLSVIVLLIDIRRELTEEELWFFNFSSHAKVVLVLTKIDKVKKNELAAAKRRIAQTLEGHDYHLVLTSAQSNKKQGIQELLTCICQELH